MHRKPRTRFALACICVISSTHICKALTSQDSAMLTTLVRKGTATEHFQMKLQGERLCVGRVITQTGMQVHLCTQKNCSSKRLNLNTPLPPAAAAHHLLDHVTIFSFSSSTISLYMLLVGCIIYQKETAPNDSCSKQTLTSNETKVSRLYRLTLCSLAQKLVQS